MKIKNIFLTAALVPLLAACQAMTPGTLAIKGGNPGDTTTSPEKSDKGGDDLALAPPTNPSSPAATPLPTSTPGTGASPEGGGFLPSPSPAPSPGAPSDPSSGSSSPQATGPIPYSGSPGYLPASGSGPTGPLAATEEPMAPKADKDGAGGCQSAYFYTNGVRLEYAPGTFASTDPAASTSPSLPDEFTFAGTLKLEVNLPVFELGYGDDLGFKAWSWYPALEGYVRVIVKPAQSGLVRDTATYVDYNLKDMAAGASATGDALFQMPSANLVLPKLEVPAGARVEIHYYHVFPVSKSIIRPDGEEICLSKGLPPPDFSSVQTPYTPEIRARFDEEILFGREPGVDQTNSFKAVHTAAYFRIGKPAERIRRVGPKPDTSLPEIPNQMPWKKPGAI